MDKCPNCGANLLPGAAKCVYCDFVVPRQPPPQPPPAPPRPQVFGAPPAAAGWGAPTGPGVGRTPYGQGMVGWKPPPAPPGPAPNFMGWAFFGLVQFLVCQLAIPGLIGAIMGFSARSEWDRGNYDSALSKLRIVKILDVVSLALAAMVLLVYILLMVVGIVASS